MSEPFMALKREPEISLEEFMDRAVDFMEDTARPVEIQLEAEATYDGEEYLLFNREVDPEAMPWNQAYAASPGEMSMALDRFYEYMTNETALSNVAVQDVPAEEVSVEAGALTLWYYQADPDSPFISWTYQEDSLEFGRSMEEDSSLDAVVDTYFPGIENVTYAGNHAPGRP